MKYYIMNEESKKISIIGTNTRYQIKKVTQTKMDKTRVKTLGWDFSEDFISNQIAILKEIINNDSETHPDSHNVFKKEVSLKMAGYRQQDILKNVLDEENIITSEQILSKLCECNMTCFYCSGNVQVLYKLVREKTQWSLDRINNDLGHNLDNVVISCLECNLKRRRKSSDAFAFTKQLVLSRHGY